MNPHTDVVLPSSPGSANLSAQPLNGDQARVLIVDDVEEAAQALAALLGMNGYATCIASGGAEALACIREFMPHCVLVDVGMPGMDGCELVQHLRAQYGDDMVLIAVSGGSESDERVAATFALVDYHLAKPVDVDALIKVLPVVAPQRN